MMSKKVRVIYKGKVHIVDVPCEPHHSIEKLEKAAIRMLERKEETERERNNAFVFQQLKWSAQME